MQFKSVSQQSRLFSQTLVRVTKCRRWQTARSIKLTDIRCCQLSSIWLARL